jgi:hypothetical protein
MRNLIFLTIFLVLGVATVFAQTNVFSPVTLINTGTCGTSSSSTITISNPNAAFGAGNKVLLIQMQGAIVNTAVAEPPTTAIDGTFGSITNYNNTGNYEFGIVKTYTTPGSGGAGTADVIFTAPLINSYSTAASIPAGVVQMVSVPQYASLTIGATLTGTAWNGTTGGVLVFEVAGTLTVNSTITMDGKGFRGGIYSNWAAGTPCDNGPYTLVSSTNPATAPSSLSSAYRGEGIGSQVADAFGRGAWANGGGGGSGHNGGGGGGGNYCAGGVGGYEFSPCYSNAGSSGSPDFTTATPVYSVGNPARRQAIGGFSLSPTNKRIFMGGGGGAGNGDNSNATIGGNGAGIIIINAQEIAGTGGIISANGVDGQDNSALGNNPAPSGTSDGVGGGGAGGSIILNTGFYSTSGLNVKANGGRGGDNYQASTCHGDGGGGGAGIIMYSGGALTPSVITSAIGGRGGLTRPDATSATDGSCWQDPYGAMAGGSCGGSVLAYTPYVSSCSVANLGGDKSLCGAASVTLSNGTASNTNKVFTWYQLVAGTYNVIAGQTGPTYSATATGTYKVQVDSVVAGCTYCSSSDVAIVSATLPIPFVGPNQVLCSTSSLNLTVQNAANFPAGTTWQWQLNGVNITGATSSILANVRTAGTYTITASATGCASTTASITLTSQEPIVVDGCRSSTGTVTLSVSGGRGGTYDWYGVSAGGSPLAGGTNTTTFTTPSISSTTTYYVQDNGLISATTGPPSSGNGFTGLNQTGNAAPGMTLSFNVTNPLGINLKGITVISFSNSCSCGTNYNIQIDVKNSGGTLVGSATNSVNCCNGTGTPGASFTYVLTFATPIFIPFGTGYTMAVNSGGTGKTIGLYATGGASYPDTYSFVTVTGTANTSNVTQAPAYLDWQVSYDPGCSRVPVIATIGGSCALPVSLVSFTGTSDNGNVNLEWITASEKDNDHFMISRASDAINFLPIATVAGKGTKSALSNYSYIDRGVSAGIVYYKLTQVDIDGAATEVGFITLFNDKGFTAQVSPNPFSSKLNVNIMSRNNDKVYIRVTDLTGKTVGIYDNLFANEKIEIGEDLPSGLFILEVSTDYEVKTFRIVKLSE